MKTFDMLYKRTKTGAIQQYKVFVALQESYGASIIKEAGQLGGKQTRHVEHINAGKNIGKANETTPEQQAEFQAESDWKKKRDEGYKSLKDLEMQEIQSPDGWVWCIKTRKCMKSNGFPTDLAGALQIALPEFNTDASGNVKPMLAKTVDWNKVKYPCFVQPKLDGVRCLMVFHTDVSEGPSAFHTTMLSRKGKEYTTLNHIQVAVGHARMDGRITESFILDGEIYSDELSFQQISSAVKKKKEDSLKLKFRAYDIITDELQEARWHRTYQLVKDINSSHITTVETYKADSQEMVKTAHDNWVATGNEGAMIRHLNGKYAQGQRSSDLLKVKEFDETEYTIIDFELGQRQEDLIAVCRDTVGGVFRAKMTGNAAYKKELWEWWTTPMETRTKNKFNNPQLTVKHFGRTDDGLPRFPVGKAIRDYE